MSALLPLYRSTEGNKVTDGIESAQIQSVLHQIDGEILAEAQRQGYERQRIERQVAPQGHRRRQGPVR
jgi:hypothetical protein